MPPVSGDLPRVAVVGDDLAKARLAEPDLVNAQMLYRRGLGWQRARSVLRERGVRGRPGHLVVPRRLDDRAPAVGHRGPARRAQTPGQPRARRDLRARLGETRSGARRIPARPPAPGPPQHRPTTGPRQGPRPPYGAAHG